MMREKEQALRVAAKCIAESKDYLYGAVFAFRDPETGKFQKGISYDRALDIIVEMLDEPSTVGAVREQQGAYNGDPAHDQMVDAARYE